MSDLWMAAPAVIGLIANAACVCLCWQYWSTAERVMWVCVSVVPALTAMTIAVVLVCASAADTARDVRRRWWG